MAGWHLPLLAVDLIPLDIPTTFAVTFMYAWIFNHTGGSAFMTLVAHAAQGIVQSAALLPEDVDATRVVWLEDALLIAVAIGLVVRPRGLARPLRAGGAARALLLDRLPPARIPRPRLSGSPTPRPRSTAARRSSRSAQAAQLHAPGSARTSGQLGHRR